MKKFLTTTYVVAILALVPAVIVGYLHDNTASTGKADSEIVKDAPASNDEGIILRLVKTF